MFKFLLTIFCVIFSLLLVSCARKHVETPFTSDENQKSCWQMIESMSDSGSATEAVLNQDIDHFQSQFEQLLAFTEVSQRVFEGAAKKVADEDPIPPGDLEQIIAMVGQGVSIVEPIAMILSRNTCWYDADSEQRKDSGLKPLTEDIRTKGLLLELAATITIYDAYINTFETINGVDRLREFVEHGDSGYGVESEMLEQIAERIVDVNNLATVKEHVAKYNAKREKIESLAQGDDRSAYLALVISGSRSFQLFSIMTATDLAAHRVSARANIIEDNLGFLRESVTGGVSEVFGNLVGTVESRKGKLFQDDEILRNLQDVLKPGDVLLEKTPFRLTDRLIPGYWGHAAIWVGTSAELDDLGVWEYEIVQPYHEQIMNHQLVAEALREGTLLSTLEHFLNIDDLLVLRRKQMADTELEKVITRSFRQIGKAYDFNFDVETTDKIVCSQLVYIAYPDICWPTERIAGRFTISPDNIANQAVSTDNFEIVELIVDGSIVTGDKKMILKRLLEEARE